MNTVIQLAAILAGVFPFIIAAWLFRRGLQKDSDGIEIIIGILLSLIGILTLVCGLAAATDLK